MLTTALCLIFCTLCRPAHAQSAPDHPAAQGDSLPYNLLAPSLALQLADPAFRELSGLGPTDKDNEFVAVSDERGEVLWMDTTGKITRRVVFRDKGDFEGIEMVGQCVYALKSNGDIYEIGCWESDKTEVVNTYKTSLKKADDTEGLGYDPRRQALLVACKGDPQQNTDRDIFAFNLKTKTLEIPPVYVVHPDEVNQRVPYAEEEKHDFFSPSGIAIQPQTQDVYLISTALKRLVVLDYQTGKIKYAVRLDKHLLPQPEGISFDREGNLYLGSEGKGGDGRLLRFDLIKH